MKLHLVLLILSCSGVMFSQDWGSIPVPADPGEGYVWELQESVSDDFNYEAPAEDKGDTFRVKWEDYYHNTWTGPGLTIWDRGHVFVTDGYLQITASRVPNTNKVYTGCVTSNVQVQYPIYVEASAKISNSTLSSDVWLLSPDDTQEIDILEAYGTSYSEGAGSDQTWFAKRIHISHHVFIRNPFQDYQPTDEGSWYYNGTLWREDFHRYGVYWRDPWHLEYYIDGQKVRTVSGESIIDPLNYTGGTGLNKAMDVIIDAEDQNWRSDQGITPTDAELANTEDHTYKVDWIRFYKPVVDVTSVNQLTSRRIQVYPNPAAEYLHVIADEPVKKLILCQLDGAEVKTEKLDTGALRLSLLDLHPGVYLLRTEFEDGAFSVQKIICL
jgi:agarase